MTTLSKLQQEVIEKFDEKVKNVKDEFPLGDFGYKVKREDEIFTIVDWGNIKKFLLQSIREVQEQTRKETIDKYFLEAEKRLSLTNKQSKESK